MRSVRQPLMALARHAAGLRWGSEGFVRESASITGPQLPTPMALPGTTSKDWAETLSPPFSPATPSAKTRLQAIKRHMLGETRRLAAVPATASADPPH